MNQMSQEEDLFLNEYTFQCKNGDQRSRETISVKTGPVCYPLETEYDEINEIFHTRCATFSDPLGVYEKAKYPL